MSFFQTPPPKKALTDQELNDAVARLQLQPEGLMAAMSLIESQTKLREEDERAYALWKSENSVAIAEAERLARQEAEAKRVAEEQAALRFAQEQEAKRQAAAREAQLLAESIAAERLSQEQAAREAAEQAVRQAEAQRLAQEQAQRLAQEQEQAARAQAEEVARQAEAQKLVQEEAKRRAAQKLSDEETAAETQRAQGEVQQAQKVDSTLADPTDPVAFLNSIHSSEPTASSGVKSAEPVNQDFMDMIFADADAENQLKPAKSSPQTEADSPEGKDLLVETSAKISGLAWSWLSVAASPLILLFVSQLKVAGASIGQSALVLGVVIFLTALIGAAGSVAAKRAGSSLALVSRASFGVWGNLIPASLILITKLFWIVAFAIVSSRLISPLIFTQSWFASITQLVPLIPIEVVSASLVLIPMFLAAAVIAALSGATMLRTQQVTTFVLFIGLAVAATFVFSSYSIGSLESQSTLSNLSQIDFTLLVAMILTLPVFTISGDFARNLSGNAQSSKVFWVSFLSLLLAPLFVATLCLTWFYLEKPEFSQGVVGETLSTMASATPIWAFVAMTIAIGVSVLQLMATLLNSGSESIKSLGLSLHPVVSQSILVTIGVGSAIAGVRYISVSDIGPLTQNLLVTTSVLVAAWVGIVLADALIRRVGYHEVSLTRSYGFYGRFNTVNVIGFVFASTLGFGFILNDGILTSWQGFLMRLTPELETYVGSYSGIAMAFALGLLIPVALGIPRIRKQENSLLELESRRQDLREFLDTVE